MRRSGKSPPPLDRGSSPPETAVRIVDDLEQLRALADPLRMRILETLCGPPRTTKQVADRLGEKPTRLYHHVDALEGAGLIRLIFTRPKRGTLEKYYQAVARQFRADPSLFPGSATPGEESWPALGAAVLEGTAAELRRLAAEPSDDMADDENRALFARLRIRARKGSLSEVSRRIEELIAELEAREEEVDDEAADVESFGLTVALFPASGDGSD